MRPDPWRRILGQLVWKTEDLEETLQSTFESVDNAGSTADETLALVDQAAGGIEEVSAKLEEIEIYKLDSLHAKVDALLAHLGIEDPRIKEGRIKVEAKTLELFNTGINDEEIINTLWKVWEGGSINAAGSEVYHWCRQMLNELNKQKEEGSKKDNE